MRTLLLIVVIVSLPNSVNAQPRQRAMSELAVDMVKLKDGPQLFGIILSRDDQNNLRFAVSREWLKENHPKTYQQEVDREALAQTQGYDLLFGRVAQWKDERRESPKLVQFLEGEEARIKEELEQKKENPQPAHSQFFLMEIKGKDVERGYSQTPRNRQVGLTAYLEKLPRVETTRASRLFVLLKEQDINPFETQVNLQDRLPQGYRKETDEQWTARKALMDYEYVKAYDLQGTGELLFPTGGEAVKPDLTQLFQALLKNSITKQLEDLLTEPSVKKANSNHWIAVAGKLADKAGVTGCRVTRVDQDLVAKRVKVHVAFLVKMPNKTWKPVWQESVYLSANEARPEMEAQIGNAKEIQQAMEVAKNLGLGEDQVTLAIRFGAATMEAQKKGDEAFFKFWDNMNQKLDSPPMSF